MDPLFFTTYTALCAFKETGKCNKALVHFARMYGKSLVTMSTLLGRVEHTRRHEHLSVLDLVD